MSNLVFDAWRSLSNAFSRFTNPNTKQGDSGRDAMAGTQIGFQRELGREELRSLYESWFMKKLCNTIPDLAVSNGGTLNLGGENADPRIIQEINNFLVTNNRLDHSLMITEFFCEAQKTANWAGGAAILIIFDDSKSWNEPVDLDNIPEILELRLFNCWQCCPFWGNDALSGKLEPEYYRFYGVNDINYQSGFIHKSRVLPFYGDRIPTDDNYFQSHQWRSISVIQKLLNEWMRYDTSSSSVADKMQKFAVHLLAIENLQVNLGMSKKRGNTYSTEDGFSYSDQVVTRAQSMAQGYGNYSILLFDKDKEQLSTQELSFQGIKDNLEFFFNLVTYASGLPKFLITGEYGGNLSSLNEGERSGVAQLVNVQHQNWESNLNTLLAYKIRRDYPNLEQYTWKWNPIWEESPKSKAEAQKIQAEVLLTFARIEETLVRSTEKRVSLQEKGIDISPILKPEEIRQSVFGTPEFGGTNIVLSNEDSNQEIPMDSIDNLVNSLTQTLDAEDKYYPPKSAQNNAKKVLEWREKYGDEVKGMTPVGWARAHQLASGEAISLSTVKRISQFARHQQNYKSARAKQKRENGNPWEYAGIVAWLGWGGDSGINWAKRISQGN